MFPKPVEKRLPGTDQSFWEFDGRLFHSRRDAFRYIEQKLSADTGGTMPSPNPPYNPKQMEDLAAEIFGSKEELDSFKQVSKSLGNLKVPWNQPVKDDVITKMPSVLTQQQEDAELYKKELMGGFITGRHIDPIEILTPPDFETTWMVGQDPTVITDSKMAFVQYRNHSAEIGRQPSEEYRKIMANLPIPVVVDKGKVYSVPTKSQATHMATSKNHDNWLVLVKIVQPPAADKPSESAPPVVVGRTTRKIHL